MVLEKSIVQSQKIMFELKIKKQQYRYHMWKMEIYPKETAERVKRS
jgi:hypothetical protein